MLKDDSKLLRMSIYRPNTQSYRYKRIGSKYGRYTQNWKSAMLSAGLWLPAPPSSGRPQDAGFEFQHTCFNFNPCALKDKNNGNVSLESYKILF